MIERDKLNNTLISQLRSGWLKQDALRYLDAVKEMPGAHELAAAVARNKARILEVLGGTEDDWQNWKCSSRIGSETAIPWP